MIIYHSFRHLCINVTFSMDLFCNFVNGVQNATPIIETDLLLFTSVHFGSFCIYFCAVAATATKLHPLLTWQSERKKCLIWINEVVDERINALSKWRKRTQRSCNLWQSHIHYALWMINWIGFIFNVRVYRHQPWLSSCCHCQFILIYRQTKPKKYAF